MPRNIEIKAKIDNLATALERATEIADSGPFDIYQEDTFYECNRGRFKLRKFSADKGELIFYRRNDEKGPGVSDYHRHSTGNPLGLEALLKEALGTSGEVKKHRQLFIKGRARIHVDQVHGLGNFLELEVVLDEDEETEHGINEAHRLLAKLDVNPANLIGGAYLDLIRAKTDGRLFE